MMNSLPRVMNSLIAMINSLIAKSNLQSLDYNSLIVMISYTILYTNLLTRKMMDYLPDGSQVCVRQKRKFSNSRVINEFYFEE